MTDAFATAPAAPGAMGQDVPAETLLAYLDALAVWREQRRVELDRLDEAVLRHPQRDALTGDIMLSMSLWKAVSDRYDLLASSWDSGRVIAQDRMRLTTLIWGRLDDSAADGTALSVSLPEACRLSDSLAASLRRTLGLDGTSPDVERRVRDLRAGVERIRDLVAEIPAAHAASAQQALVELDRRVVDLTERVRRGADVGGLLGPAEIAAATTERDLIVAASERTRTRDRLGAVRQQVAELAARGEAVRALAARTAAAVADAPHLGIPDVTALGEPPADPAELDVFVGKLERVARALEVARSAYAEALEQHTDHRAQIEQDAPRVAALPDALRPDAEHLLTRARAVATTTPVDLAHLRALTAALTAYLSAATGARR